MSTAASLTAARKPAWTPWADPAARPYVRLQNIVKRYGAHAAIDELSLDIFQGEFFALLGPSGCGKSTLLRMLAGFTEPTSGRILLDGEDVAAVPPYRRPVNMMFQSYALFPHMTVEDNIAFGLKQDGVARAEIRARVDEVVQMVQLGPFVKRKPHQLSGGQCQRVALARSLVKRPKLLLLDEPLGALDKKLREQTQFELMDIRAKLGMTFVIVTHDQAEAMTMASRIAVMDHGRIVQVGTPAELYEYPETRYVAGFLGDVNLLEGRVVDNADGLVAVESPHGGRLAVRSHGEVLPGSQAWVAVRPEKLSLSTASPATDVANSVSGRVWDIGYLGNLSVYHVRLDSGQTLVSVQTNQTRLIERPIGWDDRVYLSWDPHAAVLLTH
ncbi:putrescine transport system ATP-binding protein [Plasticicumulans lactativorans]|uniref:Spermidine/putrescine import ATP-binding protein PotA n=1 Tax=Plasticicumulans lactativorans TaxID=1133106 RepID=A0A4R2L7I1_9GAMM|nr:ABC transporter ATP-binding protein [Plasticicumulans lactativorans]TCO81928.1 putrescine transport system ATP-binding protein [Plasticicumulans lactativorans]